MKMFCLDVSNSVVVEDMVNYIVNEIVLIDILINVVGVLCMGLIYLLSDEDWNKIFFVNIIGVFNMFWVVSKNMMLRKLGVIVIVGLNVVNMLRMEMVVYVVLKVVMTMFMKCLGLEFVVYNICCNLVFLGFIEIEM